MRFIAQYLTITRTTFPACKSPTQPPLQKWKCSGSPNYICTQASDGTYNTQLECLLACKASPSENDYIKYIFGLGLLVGAYIILKKK